MGRPKKLFGKYITLENTNKWKKSIRRKSFRCYELKIHTDSKWMKKVTEKAQSIEEKLNRGQANSSKKRDKQTIGIDNLSGFIAECACYSFLKSVFGGKIDKPSFNDSKKQVDLCFSEGKKTIEVRSSCVKNGIEFAIFATPNPSCDEQYFDVIGPYSNGYKPGEIEKDFYMRVFYCCDKSTFLDLLEEPILKLYITGGATKEMMNDDTFYQYKHMVPLGGQVEIESDYRVIPMGKSLDIVDFVSALQQLDLSD